MTTGLAPVPAPVPAPARARRPLPPRDALLTRLRELLVAYVPGTSCSVLHVVTLDGAAR